MSLSGPQGFENIPREGKLRRKENLAKGRESAERRERYCGSVKMPHR